MSIPQPFNGFASAEQQAQAQALVDACSEFTGAGDALRGKAAMAQAIAEPSIDSVRVFIPLSMFADISRGPSGRLGMSLLRASSKHGAAPSKIVAPPRSASGGWSGAPDEELAASWAPEAPRPAAPPRRRAPTEEGQGADSFGAMVSLLEEQGFAGTSLSIIAANKAKRHRSGRR